MTAYHARDGAQPLRPRQPIAPPKTLNELYVSRRRLNVTDRELLDKIGALSVKHGYCYARQSALAAMMCLSRPGLQKVLKKLEKLRCIHVHREKGRVNHIRILSFEPEPTPSGLRIAVASRPEGVQRPWRRRRVLGRQPGLASAPANRGMQPHGGANRGRPRKEAHQEAPSAGLLFERGPREVWPHRKTSPDDTRSCSQRLLHLYRQGAVTLCTPNRAGPARSVMRIEPHDDGVTVTLLDRSDPPQPQQINIPERELMGKHCFAG